MNALKRLYFPLARPVFILLAGSVPFSVSKGAARVEEALSLANYLERVVAFNEDVQVALMGIGIGEFGESAARAVFEPALVLSGERVESDRPNTTEERRNLGGIDRFDQRNNLYSAGLEWFAPTGANVGFRYELRDLENNLQGNDGLDFETESGNEYVTFIGLDITQPLLRGFGEDVTFAEIRLAAGESRLAYEEYRRQMMVILSSAEAAYWNLYFAQEQEAFRKRSVEVAARILEDERVRLEAGRGTEIDVILAEAAVAERQAALAEAAFRRVEASNAARSFLSADPNDRVLLVAEDSPGGAESDSEFAGSFAIAKELNPDLRSARIRSEMSTVRVDFARDRKEPELNLTASGGFNGLGTSLDDSWEDVTDGEYPVWSLGVELRIPIGNERARSELAAALLRSRQETFAERGLEREVGSSLDNAMSRVMAAAEAVRGFKSAEEANRKILESEMESLEAGRGSVRRVIEAEDDLFESSVTLLRARVQLERARLELGLFEGSILQRHGFDISLVELGERTRGLFDGGEWSDARYRDLIDALMGSKTNR